MQNCNFEGLKEDAKFCPKCGSRVEPQQAALTSLEELVNSDMTLEQLISAEKEIRGQKTRNGALNPGDI